MTRRFDAIVIGGGQAGIPLAGRLSAAGMSVALIERKLIGGTCVNTGCTPTKTLVASAEAIHTARRGADYGFTVTGDIRVDLKAVMARKDAVVAKSQASLSAWIGGMANCTLIEGHARFESARTVRVGDELLEAERIFINTGGRALVPDMPGVDSVDFLTNTSILQLEELPRHLVVVGGSYIGLEFGQMFRRFGSEVTIVEKGSRLIGREDEDVSAAVKDILEAEGIGMRLDAECIHLRPDGADIIVGVDCTSGDRELKASHVLLAVGRRPNTDDLGLDKAGVEMDARGFIKVDDALETSVPGIWAMGDCNGRGAFTHTSYNDFEIIAANLLDDDPRRVSDRVEAYALYVDPPLGRVGMTEAAVRKSGRPALIGTRPMSRVARATEKGVSAGFIKILVDAETKLFLGASILGVTGDEVVHGILDLIYAKAPYTVLARSVPIHPNVSELLPTVVQELKPLV
ncbi:Pyruvate/2-oxoglutarate dehydrogenase complex, dihydrolipoamide dehydrogenase (E3) component [Kaistia soli DSM 19436]|uniref:Pyruvate/2-oxoglutarate dehydrogenase complex, dihydrolipoamide dehydrogenase (E3) component n=1 Tax=Kaistia soli DSM 19436 TaxID=1122133 RepID=A0A1M4XUF4_9HYPH|nr:FAD-containing oxidoreductase [Kaistia soli]SHE96872.1 Pyruvate/2-oxoglutarate dehydrogenase complex, dihydrolipoamide dehydrogenase (E3) component [Kaistia soli DSM 19436]